MSNPKWPFGTIQLGGYTLQLFLFILLPVTILVLVVAFGSQNLHHEAMRSLVGDRNLRAVHSAIASLEQEIGSRKAILTLLAQDISRGETSLDALAQESAQIRARFDGGILLLDRQLQQVDAWAVLPGAPDGLKSNPQLLDLTARISGGIFTTSLSGPPETVIVMVEPAGPQQILVGLLRVGPLIQTNFAAFLTGDQSTILVVSGSIVPGQDPAGPWMIVYESGPLPIEPQHLIHYSGVPQVMNGESGIHYDHAHQEGEHVLVYSPSEALQWGIVISEPWEEITSPLLRSTQYGPLVMVPILLLSVIALWYGAHSIVRPLNRLEKQASQLASGDFEAVRKPVGGIREIRALQAALVDMAEKVHAARQSLHNYIGAMTAGIENERRSLARELHDDTIQSLIALNQRIQMAEMRADGSSKEPFKELQNLVQQTMLNLRRLIGGLRPIYLEDLGLVTALQMLTQETGRNTGLSVSFQVTGLQRRLSADHEMSLYRMVQESLNNIVRHAQARSAWVNLVFTGENLRLSITDNGSGFQIPENSSELSRHGHFGLLGLQERAQLIGALLEIQSTPGKGTHVQITLPFSDPPLAQDNEAATQGENEHEKV